MKEVTAISKELVREACRAFDDENADAEGALKELLRQYPKNDDLRHVLLKVVVLNRLYSTNVFAVLEVARHIWKLGIDLGLEYGRLDIVDRIARVTINGKERNNYSFATKYCSWHRPDLYPIWDARVDSYIWGLRKQGGFSREFKRTELWAYPTFLGMMTEFRDRYGLQSFTFKEIDKFVWMQGEEAAEIPSTEVDAAS